MCLTLYIFTGVSVPCFGAIRVEVTGYKMARHYNMISKSIFRVFEIAFI